MCYKDWIELFSSFDVCLLPSKFSESRSGPCFDAESVVNGVFEEDQPVIRVKMSVGAKRNVFLQCLLDCNIEFAKTNQFISVDLKDENEEYIKPILPNKYEELDPRILKVKSGCGSVGYLLGRISMNPFESQNHFQTIRITVICSIYRQENMKSKYNRF